MFMLHSKLKIKKKNANRDSHERIKTDNINRDSYLKNKLTHGCKNYDQIKERYRRNCDSHNKTQNQQYTFEPNLSSKKKTQRSRSFQKFIEDQENYQNLKQMKIKEFRTEMTKQQANEQTYRPSIDKISKKICQKKNYDSSEVFERLSKQKILQSAKDDEDLFSPKILNRSKSLKRNQNISQLLHSDALRRQSKRQMFESKKKQKEEQSPMINRNTNDLVNRKIYTEFCELVPQDEEEVPLIYAWTVLSQLFFIDANPAKQDIYLALCDQMGTILCQSEQEQVKRNKLWAFIEVIVCRGELESELFGDKIEQILNSFGKLYHQRLAKPRRSTTPINSSFKPETLKKSDRYAQKFRQKVLTQTNDFLKSQEINFAFKEEAKLQDLYMADYLMKKAEMQKKRLRKQQDQLRECTFKPKLCPSKPKLFIPPRKGSANSISKSKLSCIRTHQETQTIKSTSLCNSMVKTALRLRNMNNHQRNKKNSVEVKNSDKQVLRMSIGRNNRRFSNEYKERGYPKNVENWTNYTKQKKTQIIKENKKLKGYAYKQITLK